MVVRHRPFRTITTTRTHSYPSSRVKVIRKYINCISSNMSNKFSLLLFLNGNQLRSHICYHVEFANKFGWRFGLWKLFLFYMNQTSQVPYEDYGSLPHTISFDSVGRFRPIFHWTWGQPATLHLGYHRKYHLSIRGMASL